MTPYIEYQGKKYEFRVNRYIIKEIAKLQKKHNVSQNDTSNAYEFLEDAGKIFLTTNYGLTDEQIEDIYDSFNPIELYELLGAVLDTVFTNLGGKETTNSFLREYRIKKANEN